MDAQPFILASLALFSVAATLVIGISYISYQMKLKRNPKPAISSFAGETEINFINNEYARDFRRKTGTHSYTAHQSINSNQKEVRPIINQTYFHEPEIGGDYNQKIVGSSSQCDYSGTKYPTHFEVMGTDEGRITSLRPVTVDGPTSENIRNDRKLLTFYED